MALELVGGAAVGAVFGEFLSGVIKAKQNVEMFRSKLEELEATLEALNPVIMDIDELNRRLNRTSDYERETEMIKRLMEEGKELVSKCFKVGRWSLHKKWCYQSKLIKLDNKLLRFLNLHLQAHMARDQKEILLSVNQIVMSLSLSPNLFLVLRLRVRNPPVGSAWCRGSLSPSTQFTLDDIQIDRRVARENDNGYVRNHQNPNILSHSGSIISPALRISEYEDDEMNDNGLCEVLALPPRFSDAADDETTSGGLENEFENMTTQCDDEPLLMQRLHALEATAGKLKIFTPAIVLLLCFNLVISFLIFMYK